jgi:hypothetical protein
MWEGATPSRFFTKAKIKKGGIEHEKQRSF